MDFGKTPEPHGAPAPIDGSRRFVVQRQLFPQFLETYTEAVRNLKVGNPTLVDNAGDKLPDLAFGPVINAAQAQDLDRLYADALKTGATPIYEGKFDDSLFLPGQDRSAGRKPHEQSREEGHRFERQDHVRGFGGGPGGSRPRCVTDGGRGCARRSHVPNRVGPTPGARLSVRKVSISCSLWR